jgi:hypothetical protein
MGFGLSLGTFVAHAERHIAESYAVDGDCMRNTAKIVMRVKVVSHLAPTTQ